MVILCPIMSHIIVPLDLFLLFLPPLFSPFPFSLPLSKPSGRKASTPNQNFRSISLALFFPLLLRSPPPFLPSLELVCSLLFFSPPGYLFSMEVYGLPRLEGSWFACLCPAEEYVIQTFLLFLYTDVFPPPLPNAPIRLWIFPPLFHGIVG